MRQLSNLRAALIGVCAMAAAVAVCHAQFAEISQPASSSATPSDAGASSSGQSQPVAAAPAAASSWTAGATSFNPASNDSWRNNKASFGAGVATGRTAAPDGFAEHAQPEGIWRVSPSRVASAIESPVAAKSLQPVSASSSFSARGQAHSGSRSSHSIRVDKHVTPHPQSAHVDPVSTHGAGAQSIGLRSGAGALSDSMKAPSLPGTLAPGSSLKDRIGSGTN